MKAADISSLFHALGTFGHRPTSAALDQLLPRATTLLPSMNPTEVCSIYWGLGMARATDNPLFEQLTSSDIPALWEGGKLTDSCKRQVFQGYLAGVMDVCKVRWEPKMMGDLKAAWVKNRGLGGPHPLCLELQELLKELGVAVKADKLTADEVFVVDLQFTAAGGRLSALQLVDEWSVACNTEEQLAPLKWQRDILERNGFAHVQFLPVHDMARVAPGRLPEFLSDLLRRLGVNVNKQKVEAAARRWEARGHVQIELGGGGGKGEGGGKGGRRQQRQRKEGGGGGGGVGGQRQQDWGELKGGVSASEADVLMQQQQQTWKKGGRQQGQGQQQQRRQRQQKDGGGGGSGGSWGALKQRSGR